LLACEANEVSAFSAISVRTDDHLSSVERERERGRGRERKREKENERDDWRKLSVIAARFATV